MNVFSMSSSTCKGHIGIVQAFMSSSLICPAFCLRSLPVIVFYPKSPIVLRTQQSRCVRAVLKENAKQPRASTPDPDRQVWSAGEKPPINYLFPPGKFPFALEIDFVLNHPIADAIIAVLVGLNCLAFALQTVDVGPALHQAFQSYESNLSIVFLIEYFGRWYGKGLSPRYLLTRGMILDFIAVSPIGFAVTDQSEALFVRILRLSRILRIQRMMMDTEGGKGVMDGMTNIQIRLAGIGLSLFSLLYVSAGLFFQVEKDVNPAVQNFFDAFYFSTTTLFTVGFGDVTPLTSLGKTITVMTVLTGAVLVPYQLTEIERVRQLSGMRSQGSLEDYPGKLAREPFPLYNFDAEVSSTFLSLSIDVER